MLLLLQNWSITDSTNGIGWFIEKGYLRTVISLACVGICCREPLASPWLQDGVHRPLRSLWLGYSRHTQKHEKKLNIISECHTYSQTCRTTKTSSSLSLSFPQYPLTSCSVSSCTSSYVIPEKSWKIEAAVGSIPRKNLLIQRSFYSCAAVPCCGTVVCKQLQKQCPFGTGQEDAVLQHRC